MPLTSQMHVPKLMGEDSASLRYECDKSLYADEGHETRELEGVTVTMAPRKKDGKMGVLACAFKKPSFDQKKAGAWLAAQRFALEPADLHAVKGVEIFSVGLWNGKQISESDLEHIVEAFSANKGRVRPFLKLGHDDGQRLLQEDGLPAAGWVENVRKVGTKLVADFVDIPRKVYQLITNKAYRKVSCEIYNNVDISGRSYPKMLGAVALLGADLPGVLNLNDILSMYSAGSRAFAGIEKFAGDQEVDIISTSHQANSIDNTDGKEGSSMSDVEQFKAKLEAAEKELGDAKAEVERYKQVAEEARVAADAAAAAKKKADRDAFITKLQSEKLVTKSAVEYLDALLGDDKEKYSVEKTEHTKFELVEKVLKFAQEAGKVNLGETTKDEQAAKHQDLNSKIEKYAKDHNVSYGAAYSAVTKGMDI